jgi:hypothetical protein
MDDGRWMMEDGRREYRNTGIMEYWNIGILE